MSKKPAIDGSVYGAFAALLDGEWHSDEELRRRCGAEGPRRARMLRSPKYGGLRLVRLAGPGGPGYRLLLGRNDDAARESLLRRKPVRPSAEVSRRRAVLLSDAELVLLAAVLENNPHLHHPRVARLWEEVKRGLSVKLRGLLADQLRDPFDLFVTEQPNGTRKPDDPG